MMSEITVTLPDGSSRRVPAGATAGDVAAAISPRLAKAALAAVVDDRLVDLTYPLHDGRARAHRHRPTAPRRWRSTATPRRTCWRRRSRSLFPGTQCGIGPATDEGFFYDFVVERPFVPEDLEAIEKKMKELAAQDLPYERQMWPREEALRLLRGEAASRSRCS